MRTNNKNRHDKVYARCFKDLGKGHAIYRNIPAEVMRPGACGYFDQGGAWVNIFQVAKLDEPLEETLLTRVTGAVRGTSDAAARLFGLLDPEGGQEAAATAAPTRNIEPIPRHAADGSTGAGAVDATIVAITAPTLEPLPEGEVKLHSQVDDSAWGMKESKKISLSVIKATANVSVPNAPIGGGFVAKLKNNMHSGAVLVTNGPVSYHQADPTPVFEDWMDTHLPTILNGKHGRLVRKRGVWIVTRTYTAKRRAVAVMQSRGSSVLFDVDVEVPNIARVGPSAEWWRETVHKPGWESHGGPNDVVLFMSGIYWKPRRVNKGFKVRWEHKVKEVLAAGHPLQPVVVQMAGEQEGSPEYLCMTPTAVGEIDAVDNVPRINYYDYMDAPSDIGEDSEEE